MFLCVARPIGFISHVNSSINSMSHTDRKVSHALMHQNKALCIFTSQNKALHTFKVSKTVSYIPSHIGTGPHVPSCIDNMPLSVKYSKHAFMVHIGIRPSSANLLTSLGQIINSDPIGSTLIPMLDNSSQNFVNQEYSEHTRV